MLLDLFDWLRVTTAGFRVFGYLTLRAILAALTALTIALLVGPSMIRMLAARQIGQVVRDDGPRLAPRQEGHADDGRRADPGRDDGRARCCGPTSRNRFVWIALGVTLAFGLIGFYDDYLKLVVSDPQGLAARWKYLWQSLAGPRAPRPRCG